LSELARLPKAFANKLRRNNMALFDALIDDIAGRFGLGTKAGPLVREVLNLAVGSPQGLSGFLDKLKSVGLGSEIASWLGNTNPAPLATQQVERALGSTVLGGIANRLGIGSSVVSSAVGYVLPKLIGALTPGGVVPATLPSEVRSFLSAAVSPRTSTVREQVPPRHIEMIQDKPKTTRWLWPAAIAVLALGVFILAERTPEPVATTVAQNAPQPAPVTPALSDKADDVASATNAKLADMASAANAKVTDALTSLKAGFTAKDLVDILNLSIINFPTAGYEVPASEMALLQKAAAQIKRLASGAVLEIAGYTDNTGDAAANQVLSQQRADAVRNALINAGVDPSLLVAKGYGSANPVGSNESDEGRLHNRRIEYHVIKS
jgi:OOP family OmpA-OmpF porin